MFSHSMGGMMFPRLEASMYQSPGSLSTCLIFLVVPRSALFCKSDYLCDLRFIWVSQLVSVSGMAPNALITTGIS